MLLTSADLCFPTPPEQLFGRKGPLVVEVGFGDGRFTAGLARRHPDWNIIGVEVSAASVKRARSRFLREGITNVRIYKGNGSFLVRNIVPAGRLHRVYVNFPDPWPRKKHHANRLLRRPFFALLSTRLEPDGALWLTTDHEAYFRFALEEARSTGLYRIEQKPPPPPTLQTKYAQKWLAQDKPIYHAVFTRLAEAAPHPPDRLVPMHHARLSGPLPALDAFTKLVHRFDGGTAVVLEAFRRVGRDEVVFVTQVDEGDLIQDLLIEARPDADGGLFVGVKRFGDPLPTRGVREAVHCVTEWLAAQGLTVVDRRY
ncbi:MAG: tRNA (guanosine(46)-N7)-methyltransferase TrmB [Bacteroidetes bacterium]|nr:MAG: tRNA (guanosine(46)-N7)-methyltransferase TrmB [Bacteroidota bacterium]